MTSLFLLIPLGVLFVAGAAAVLLWAIDDGQFDALDEISTRMPDDEPP